ncbi:hypothetical protein C8R45DRAFT_995043 [Mycena sanguinolenta]|nr:hypothetical protein C8R45DRAFT_995043 [Mycena sanguinolenta]
MALRSFTVYCDAPVDAAVDAKPSQASKATVLGSTTPNPNIPAASTASLASTAEKENLHPVTGERCGAVSDSASKKRKTNVLATKTVAVKKQKESKEEGKKARSASSSAGKAKKDGKSTRKTAKKPSRRVSPLPKLDEEDVAVRDRLMQADIASRCYELTVSPLADVTQAYDAGFDVNSLLAGFTSEDSAKFQKATSTEPEIRDYFSPSHSSGSSARLTPPLGAAAQEPKVFNTPERRHIYSAFTFTTPSPSSERFRQASRSLSPTVPRLDLAPATSA